VRAVGISVDRFLEADLQLELWGEEVPSTGYRVPRTEEGLLSRGSAASESLRHWALGTRYSALGTERQPHPRDAALQTAIDRIRMRWGMKGVRVG